MVETAKKKLAWCKTSGLDCYITSGSVTDAKRTARIAMFDLARAQTHAALMCEEPPSKKK